MKPRINLTPAFLLVTHPVTLTIGYLAAIGTFSYMNNDNNIASASATSLTSLFGGAVGAGLAFAGARGLDALQSRSANGAGNYGQHLLLPLACGFAAGAYALPKLLMS